MNEINRKVNVSPGLNLKSPHLHHGLKVRLYVGGFKTNLWTSPNNQIPKHLTILGYPRIVPVRNFKIHIRGGNKVNVDIDELNFIITTSLFCTRRSLRDYIPPPAFLYYSSFLRPS